MTGNKTFTIIKPTAVKKGHTGHILAMIEEAGFRIEALKMIQMSKKDAEAFYTVHKGKPFFEILTEFMSSGPVYVAILEKDNAVQGFRKLIGATDPTKAEDGTIRKLFATSLTENAVHGSDSDENAVIEGNFFFSKMERHC